MKNELLQNLLRTEKSLPMENDKQHNTLRESSDCKYSQDFVQIDNIIDGLIFTKDGRVISIIEILPINYYEKEEDRQYAISRNFGNSFKTLPSTGHFKIMYSNINLDTFEQNVRSHMKLSDSPQLKERFNDYIEHIRSIQTATKWQRYFYIFEYEGSADGKKTTDYQEIFETMRQNQKDIISAFNRCGNICINLADDDMSILEVFYSFYNPNSSVTESLYSRINKVTYTARQFNQPVLVSDILSPKGIRFEKWDTIAYDGMYHTYLMLKDTGFPNSASLTWIEDLVTNLDNGDLDIFYKQANSSVSSFFIDRADVISRGLAAKYEEGEIDKQQELLGKSQNARYIKDCVKNGDDLYEVTIIVTLRETDRLSLKSKVLSYIRNSKTKGYSFDRCMMNTDRFFDMVCPVHNIDDKLFKLNKRNFTNLSLSSLYCFTSYKMFDMNGVCIGRSLNNRLNNSSLFSFDNFNKSIYASPHIFIGGTTGGGKTFAELDISSRMRMNGYRVMFVLPLKGHEYKEAVESMEGEYIKLGPGSNNCINVCEIRPSEKLNVLSFGNDEELISELKKLPSLLSEKVTSLITFFRMLMDTNDTLTRDEAGELNVAFTNVYNRFGITEDNESIFNRDMTIKQMPILEDMYKEILSIPSLKRISSVLKPWVSGNCKNMNGQTNVNMDNKVIAFDVNEDDIGEELLPAFMFVAFECCYGIARRDLDERCIIVLDETWKFLLIIECAKYIFKMIKILRAYKTGLIMATQDLQDCMKNEYGISMITLPAIQIFLKSNKKALEAISAVVSLSEQNIEDIQSLSPGQGFFFSNEEKVKISFDLSPLEMELYEPSQDEKDRWHKYRMAKAKNRLL